MQIDRYDFELPDELIASRPVQPRDTSKLLIVNRKDQSISIQTRDQLDCRPCGIHGKKACPKGHFNCSNIDELEILTHIDSILQIDN